MYKFSEDVIASERKQRMKTTTTEVVSLSSDGDQSSPLLTTPSESEQDRDNSSERMFDLKSTYQSNGSKPHLSKLDSFNFETKFVVLGFMKNVPKDLDQRTWTPVSSTPSSEAGDARKRRPVLRRQKRKSKKSPDVTQAGKEKFNISHSEFVACGPSPRRTPPTFTIHHSNGQEIIAQVNTHPNVDRSTAGSEIGPLTGGSVEDPRYTQDLPVEIECHRPNYERTASSTSSSRGEASEVTDADDELDSSCSSRLDSGLSDITSHVNKLQPICDEYCAADGITDPQSHLSPEDDKKPAQVYLNIDLPDAKEGESDRRQKQLSSTQTLVPDNTDTLDDVDAFHDSDNSDDFGEEDIGVFTDTVPGAQKPDRALLHLDLDLCKTSIIQESTGAISTSLSTVIAQSSVELEDEVNAAVLNGRITPAELFVASSLASPETQVALILQTVADRINEEWGDRIQAAVGNAFPLQPSTDNIPYEQFQAAFTSNVLGNSVSRITEVALCLMYSQRLMFAMLQSGHRSVNYLFDYAAILIADKAADFIINQGGWSSLGAMNIDTTPLSITPESGSSRVNSPTKLVKDIVERPERQTVPSPSIPTIPENSSSDEWSDTHDEPTSTSGFSLSSYIPSSVIINRIHYLGAPISVAAAILLLGVAAVLSKH